MLLLGEAMDAEAAHATIIITGQTARKEHILIER